jgi:hypothetical protein
MEEADKDIATKNTDPSGTTSVSSKKGNNNLIAQAAKYATAFDY